MSCLLTYGFACPDPQIEPEAFQNLPALEELDLAYNTINELDFAMLDQVGTLSSLRLNMSHNHMFHLEMKLAGPGREQLFHSNVKMLDLSHNNISTVARYFFQPVETSLTHLYMSWNNLRNATRDVFGNMPHLHWLDLSVNELLEIDFDTFRNTRFLQVSQRTVAFKSPVLTLVFNPNTVKVTHRF